jgi:mRNA interferase RelE/StbE
MYKILYTPKVMKELDELDNFAYLKIRERILSLINEPRPVGSLKLTSENGYRVRSGDYRILYEIDDKMKIVKLLRIGHRKDIYKKK